MNYEQIQLMQLYRQMMKSAGEEWDGSLEQAKRGADRFTKDYGIKAMVIRKKNKYDWVSEHYFKNYKYTGKYFYETQVDESEV